MLVEHSGLAVEKIRKILSDKGTVYFLGIGGVSMSALAELFIYRGYRVCGSDAVRGDGVLRIECLGGEVFVPHKCGNVRKILPSLLVYSLSIDCENAEYLEAKELGIPVISRAELLGALMQDYEVKITVMGSHGKSTVTAMLAKIFSDAGYSPTVISGADIGHGSTLLYGKTGIFITEACEYKRSFLRLFPDLCLLLNAELDHTDCYGSDEEIIGAFLDAAERSRAVIINGDDKNTRHIAEKAKRKVAIFGKGDADFLYEIKAGSDNEGVVRFKEGEDFKEIYLSLSVFGEHNFANAIAAFAAASRAGVPSESIAKSLAEFKGIPRRLELIKSSGRGDVYYDYAHHPTEIRKAIEALRNRGYKNIGVVFCPHTYSRTKSFFGEFAESLSKADFALITDIYGAREEPIPGIDAESLAHAVGEARGKGEYIRCDGAFEAIFSREWDCLVLMGAGNLDCIKNVIAKEK